MRWSSMTRSTSWTRSRSSAAAPFSASRTSHVSSRITRTDARTPPRRRRRGRCPGARAWASRRSRLARPFHDEVFGTPATRRALDEDEDAVAGLELREHTEERGGIGDGLLADLDDDVAAAEAGPVRRAARHDVGDEQPARDREPELGRGLAAERLDAAPPALLVPRAGKHGLLGGHLGDRHAE